MRPPLHNILMQAGHEVVPAEKPGTTVGQGEVLCRDLCGCVKYKIGRAPYSDVQKLFGICNARVTLEPKEGLSDHLSVLSVPSSKKTREPSLSVVDGTTHPRF